MVGEESNYIIIERNLPLLKYDAQLVEIIESDSELFRDVVANGEYITLFEMRRRMKNNQTGKIEKVVCKYNDRLITVVLPLEEESWLYSAMSPFEEKFLIYRGVPKSDICPCQW